MEDVTIYDIAMRAGVSASTVSRVINNYQYVKDDTRAKIIKIMNECNFVPNDTARSLTTKTSRMIGILIADLRTTHHTDGVYVIEHEFSKNGYACLIYNTGADPESQASYIQLLSQRKIDAVVMMGSVYQNEAVQKAIETYIRIRKLIGNVHLDLFWKLVGALQHRYYSLITYEERLQLLQELNFALKNANLSEESMKFRR